MAKPMNLPPLSFHELVIRADAATLKAALEARLKVDDLLAEREAAYRRIAELEQQVDTLMGEPGVFPFPEPPLPVFGFTVKKDKPAPKATAPAAPEETDDETVEEAGDSTASHEKGKK